jgi:hypothetical protein
LRDRSDRRADRLLRARPCRRIFLQEHFGQSGNLGIFRYGDQHHYATVQRGHIIDDGKEYSLSEWASKVAGGTSRNAWRDLWFKEPLSKTWVPAQLLRDQARQEAQEQVNAPTLRGDMLGQGAKQ